MTSSRTRDLPDFDRPPLNELVLSIQFASLPFKNFHSGLLWERFRETYPEVDEQPPIDPVFETFGTATKVAPPSLQFVPIGMPSRYWFVSKDGTELLQVQHDRLVHNWRQRKPEDHYPRYEPLRDRFEREIDIAAAFFRETELGEITCNQCEVSYINLIKGEERSDPNALLSDIFTLWAEKYSDKYLGKIERGQFNISYVLPGESGREPLGRLHIVVQPGVVRADSTPVLRLQLTARGRPRDENVASALNWLDIGRDVIVRAFASITTKKMHRVWGRKDR